jgi:hypothetical protein
VLPDLHVLQEADADALRHLAGDLGRHLRVEPGQGLDDHPPLQHERRRRDGVVAVDEDRLDGHAVVVVPQVVDHV